MWEILTLQAVSGQKSSISVCLSERSWKHGTSWDAWDRVLHPLVLMLSEPCWLATLVRRNYFLLLARIILLNMTAVTYFVWSSCVPNGNREVMIPLASGIFTRLQMMIAIHLINKFGLSLLFIKAFVHTSLRADLFYMFVNFTVE